MATFFSVSDTDDTGLLHPDIASHADLARTVNAVEAEVIAEFTRQEVSPLALNTDSDPAGLYQVAEQDLYFTTFLWGYRPTASECAGYAADRADWSGLAAALRLTIANVVSHRLRNYDADPNVLSETHGRERWEYGKDRDAAWPRGWDRPLRRYIPRGYDPRIRFSL